MGTCIGTFEPKKILSSGALQIYLQHPQVPGARDPAGRHHHRRERHRDDSGAVKRQFMGLTFRMKTEKGHKS